MSASIGPTLTMPLRKVRPGDVLFRPVMPAKAIHAVGWVDGQVVLVLEDFTTMTGQLDDEVDVHRPMYRTATGAGYE